MHITNSTQEDIPMIFEMYRIATDYMKSKNQVYWPEFPSELINQEIKEKRQWKIAIEDQIACIWVTALNDELIWEEANDFPSVYLHRIATNPIFRGQNLVKNVVKWADVYCRENQLKYIRMDTVGYNEGLIHHYTKLGFEYLGMKELTNTKGLPDHYLEDDVCLFQRKV